MIVSTPYTECYVKRSFLYNEPIYGHDKTIFAILIGIRFVRNRAPLYIIYIPSIGAIYDKVDQCAIFNREIVPNEEITQQDVAWWDCISDYWQLLELKFLKGFTINATMRTNKTMSGTYLFTADPQNKHETINWGQSEIWHEHKTKTYFFDFQKGVLCCAPNNKLQIFDSSLTPKSLDSPKWLRAYDETPLRATHENETRLGDSVTYDYQ